jgi:hypothetical protein
MRWLQACGVALLLCGCHAKQPAGVPEVQRVAVGDSFADAHVRVLASGATDISDSVGLLTEPSARMHWYELRDGTCLCVRVVANGAQETIRGLTLGEPGRGYGDKLQWLEQRHRETEFVRLR